MSYTKLFSEIVTSTIWTEDDKTRIVWITMLALANRYGEVMASVPGLARQAHVKLAECEESLNKLSNPDPYSRTPDLEGRRIQKIDGGWMLVNYEKYRQKMSAEDCKAQAAERQRRFRERKKVEEKLVTHSVTQSNGSSRSVTESNDKQKQKQKQKQSAEEIQEFLSDLWKISNAVSRTRSSKKEVLDEYKRLSPKPDHDAWLKNALAWFKCKEWTREGCKATPGLHRAIKSRKFDDPPPKDESETQNQPYGRQLTYKDGF